MTTAIEQAKREMYEAIAKIKLGAYEAMGGIHYAIGSPKLDELESSLETYLEQLRQQYEEMASTAHSRFESIQSLEAANEKANDALRMANGNTARCSGISIDAIRNLEDQLAKMTESRDMFRNLHQAATHAAIERHGEASTSGQTSGDRASCEQAEAKDEAILCVVMDCQQIVSDWAVYGYRAKKQMKKLAYVLNSNPELTQAMKSFEKPSCMHSFHLTQTGYICTFCGVGK